MGNDITDQLHVAPRSALTRQHGGLRLPTVPIENTFNLAELDTMAPDLDLIVATAKKLDNAVSSILRQVAGAIKAWNLGSSLNGF